MGAQTRRHGSFFFPSRIIVVGGAHGFIEVIVGRRLPIRRRWSAPPRPAIRLHLHRTRHPVPRTGSCDSPVFVSRCVSLDQGHRD